MMGRLDLGSGRPGCHHKVRASPPEAAALGHFLHPLLGRLILEEGLIVRLVLLADCIPCTGVVIPA